MTVRTLGQLASDGVLTFGDGYRTKRAEHGTPGYRILRVADVNDGTIDRDSPDFVSEQFRAQIGSKLSEEGDVLLTTKGTVGRVAVMPQGERVVYSPQLCYFRVHDEGVLDSRFLRYWFQSPAFWSQACDRMNNTDMAAYINLADVRSLAIDLLPAEQQRGIAEVLGALDDKIAANREVTMVVPKLFDTLFATFTMSSEFHVPLTDLCRVAKGVSYRSHELDESDSALVTLKSVTRGGDYARRGLKAYTGEPRDDQVIKPGEIVVAQTDLTQAADVVGRAVRVPADHQYTRLIASLDLAVVRPVPGVSNEFLLGSLRQPSFREHCRSMTSGTTVLHLARGAFESFETATVDRAAMERFSERAATLWARADAAEMENKTLAATRDALLPLLMSGKVRVKHAEKTVGEMV